MLRKILLFKAVRSECVEECVFLSHSIWTRFHAHPPLHRVYPYSPRSFWSTLFWSDLPCPALSCPDLPLCPDLHIIMCFCSTDSLNLCLFPSFSLFLTLLYWNGVKWRVKVHVSGNPLRYCTWWRGRLRKCSIMERDGGSVASLLD